MKKIFLPFLLLFISTNLFAQMSIIGSLGMGGGIVTGYLNPNLKDLNNELKFHNLKEFEGGMFGFGGGGGLILGNIRIGGYGIGGSKETISMRATPSGPTYQITSIARLDYGYGLGVIGYQLFNFGDLRIAFDMGIGGGSLELQIIDKMTGASSWNNLLDVYGNTTNVSKTLSMNFFYFQPSLVVEYIYGGFLKFFIAGDYSGIVNGKWKQDGEFDVTSVPDMKFSGFTLRAGVYLGIFL